MARSLWSGSLSFGLVNVPVRLFSAARDLDYHFHQLHERDHARIEQRRFCSKEDVEVGWDDVAHSYETEQGEQVVVTDEELASVEPRKTRTIDIEAFVDGPEVDPIYFDHPYFLAPAGQTEGTLRAYQLLVDVMERTDRVALGRFVMRTKEYLVAVRVRDGALALTTLRFHDEVRPAKDVPTGGKKPAKAALERAVELIDTLTRPWEPERYEDRYRARLEAVIERKRKGQRIRAPRQEKEPSPAPDLMAALERTLASMDGDGDDGGEKKDGRSELRRLTRDELYERAQERDVSGRSSMSKDELVDALDER